MEGFAAGERVWTDRLRGLRNTVRQEVVGRQLADHVSDGSTVLDVGCGQGTQAIRLAVRGCRVIGVDPSAELLARLTADAGAAGVEVETLKGRLEDLASVLGSRTFEVVCAHGLLMYLDDIEAALASLAARVVPGGLLSVTFRNAAALAFRPGMRRQWRAALDSFDAQTYINELGVPARAQRREDVTTQLENLGLIVEAWYGVRIFTDPAPVDEPPPAEGLALLVEAELQAGRRDPYRHLGSQIHLVARRGTTASHTEAH